MKRMRWEVLVGLWLVGSAPCWALTVAQRNVAVQTAASIQQKCQQIQQWAGFVNQMEQQGWTNTYSPYPSGSVITTYDAAGQTTVQSAYTQLKTDLQTLVSQLP